MTKTIITTKPAAENSNTRESDGRFALQLRTSKAVQRQLRRDAERDARRLELIELYGDDADMYA
jgi:hypothetical protein